MAKLDRLFARTAYQGDEDLVFAHPHTGRPMDRSKLLKRYKAALRRAGVRDVRLHDLRHTFGTRMAAAGVPMRTLQEWMGHRDFKTTLIYADYLPSEREADLVDRAFRPESGLPSADGTPRSSPAEPSRGPTALPFTEAMTAKEQLRRAIDELTEAEAAETLEFLARRHGGSDALDDLLEHAPLDDEPTTPQEDEGAAEAREQVERGELHSAEQIKREIA